jgi:N-acetylglucosaminyldiphosphoundecaprenol N-acetyl-beta-D-mannosaminyltransferase
MRRVPILGLPLAATDYTGAVAWVKEAAISRERAYAVSAANTHLTTLSRHDREFGEVMVKFDVIFPDGMPLVWRMNRKLGPDQNLNDRVYGPNLMLEVIKATAGDARYRHFLLGGRESTLEKLAGKFTAEFPGTVIAGAYSPPFGHWSEEENESIHRRIRESGANLVWVGLGCPKQERWIASQKDALPPAVYFGIGAAFAFHAGEVSQAPAWMQDKGLEWLYRLCAEPARLWKRYFLYNSLFLWYSLKD